MANESVGRSLMVSIVSTINPAVGLVFKGVFSLNDFFDSQGDKEFERLKAERTKETVDKLLASTESSLNPYHIPSYVSGSCNWALDLLFAFRNADANKQIAALFLKKLADVTGVDPVTGAAVQTAPVYNSNGRAAVPAPGGRSSSSGGSGSGTQTSTRSSSSPGDVRTLPSGEDVVKLERRDDPLILAYMESVYYGEVMIRGFVNSGTDSGSPGDSEVSVRFKELYESGFTVSSYLSYVGDNTALLCYRLGRFPAWMYVLLLFVLFFKKKGK
jgi:hypothetical protein